jgi:tetratricopeptide (TPR) repeat protein
MQGPLRVALLAFLFWGICLPGSIALAETGYLVVHVEDVHGHPVRGVQVGVKGDGGSGTSDPHGTVRIRLAPQTQVKDWVTLQVLHSPPGKDLVLLSPWDARAVVPSFENKSDNFVNVVVVESGDRAALTNPTALRTFAEKINKANAPKTANTQAAEDPKANLDAVAKQYGLTSDDLDTAIRAWGSKTTDPYDVGLAALYAGNYDTASSNLKDSLKQREQKLATALKDVADAACFLGQSLYRQGKYRESAVAYQRCLQIRPDDLMVLNNTAMTLDLAGDNAGAEALYVRAVALGEKVLGPDHPNVAMVLENFGMLLWSEGDYPRAESLYRRALAADEKMGGPDHPAVARDLANLAELLETKGDYATAEALHRRALAIDENVLGPDHPDVAIILNNRALMLKAKRDYTGAEPLYRRALAIDEKAFGPDDPVVASVLGNLAGLLEAKGDTVKADSLFRKALAIDKKALGLEHPAVARDLNNLGGLLFAERDYVAAELRCREALAIDEKTFGPYHPQVATDLNNIAGVLFQKGDADAAEPLFRRALAIDEKALGPNHPTTQHIKLNLDDVLKKQKGGSNHPSQN